MSGIYDLYARFRHLIHEAAKFGIVGAAGFVVQLGSTNLLRYQADMGKYKAITVATVIATVVTFLGNRYWTYRHRVHAGTARESVMFFVMNGVGLIILYGCVALVVDGFGEDTPLWYNVANITGIILGTIFRFYSYRKWVWKAPLEDVLEGHESLEPTGAQAVSAPVADSTRTGLGD